MKILSYDEFRKQINEDELVTEWAPVTNMFTNMFGLDIDYLKNNPHEVEALIKYKYQNYLKDQNSRSK